MWTANTQAGCVHSQVSLMELANALTLTKKSQNQNTRCILLCYKKNRNKSALNGLIKTRMEQRLLYSPWAGTSWVLVPSFWAHTAPFRAPWGGGNMCHGSKVHRGRHINKYIYNYITLYVNIISAVPIESDAPDVLTSPLLKRREQAGVQNVLFWFPGAVSVEATAALGDDDEPGADRHARARTVGGGGRVISPRATFSIVPLHWTFTAQF